MNRTSTSTSSAQPIISTRGRRAIVVMLIIAAVVIPLSVWLGRRDGSSATDGPKVGGDLHAIAAVGDSLFVSGHAGAGSLSEPGVWKQISSLDDKDGMGWAKTPTGILVGGHEGLYFSDDDGVTFAKAGADLPFSDVHALGAAGDTVYLASPEGGLFISTDGGASFTKRSDIGGSFMGTIEVDPADPTRAIAPDMQNGAVITTDGGVTWKRLGGPGATMAMAWDPVDRNEITVIGMDGAASTTDGGTTWADLDVPKGTSAATYNEDGQLIVAALNGQRARVFRRDGTTWTALGQTG